MQPFKEESSLSYLSKIFSPIKPENLRPTANQKNIQSPSLSTSNQFPKSNFLNFQNEVLITNNLLIKFPLVLQKEDILELFLFFGDIEKLYVKEKQIEISYFDIDSSIKAYNEIKYNFTKLNINNGQDKGEQIIEYRNDDFYNKYFISITLCARNQIILCSNIQCLIVLIKQMAMVFKIYQQNVSMTCANLLFQFKNSKDKILIDFMLRRWNAYSMKEEINNKFMMNESDNANVNVETVDFPDLSNYLLVYAYSKTEDYFNCLNKNNLLNNNCPSLNWNLNFNYNRQNMPSMFNQNYPMVIKPTQTYGNNYNLFSNTNSNQFSNSFFNSNKENINPTNNDGQSNQHQTKNSNKIFLIEKDTIKIGVKVDSFTGIKQRNIPEKDRKKYVIIPENIINETDQRTTLMVKNIPRNISQKFLMKVFNMNYNNDYNFLYLPVDFTKKVNVGYAFINFKNCKRIVQFYLDYNCKQWPFAKNMKCYLSYARIQGFRAIAQHFEKSDIMKQQNNDMKPFIQDD